MPSTLPFMPADDEHLDVAALETWLWDAACAIRGAADAPNYGRVFKGSLHAYLPDWPARERALKAHAGMAAKKK